jgi:hypothetical protein
VAVNSDFLIPTGKIAPNRELVMALIFSAGHAKIPKEFY